MANFEESFMQQVNSAQTPTSAPAEKPKLSLKFTLLIGAVVVAGILAILSVVIKPQSQVEQISEAEKSARIFFNYLIIGQETDAPLPEYKNDATYYIEDIITQSNKETTLNYLKRAKELHETFKSKINLDDFEELNADFVDDQGYDLDFLKFITEKPAPSFEEIIKADKIANKDFARYLDNTFGAEGESFRLSDTANAYIDELHELKSVAADDYAFNYKISTYYDFYEAAVRLNQGCREYDCDYHVDVSDNEAFAETIDQSYEDMINAPRITAVSIASKSYDIIEEFTK